MRYLGLDRKSKIKSGCKKCAIEKKFKIAEG